MGWNSHVWDGMRWDTRHFHARDGIEWDRCDGKLVGWDKMGHSTLP